VAFVTVEGRIGFESEEDFCEVPRGIPTHLGLIGAQIVVLEWVRSGLNVIVGLSLRSSNRSSGF
jgi:hypothetical protein